MFSAAKNKLFYKIHSIVVIVECVNTYVSISKWMRKAFKYISKSYHLFVLLKCICLAHDMNEIVRISSIFIFEDWTLNIMSLQCAEFRIPNVKDSI